MIQATAWSVIRSVLKDNYSFAEMKDIAGEAGLPVFTLGGITQSYQGGYSKGQLMDKIDQLFSTNTTNEQSRVVVNAIRIMIDRKNELAPVIDERIRTIGFYLNGNEPLSLKFQLDLETTSLSQSVHESLKKSIIRFRDGDISGSIASICSSIDKLTEEVYQSNPGLGDHFSASFQERVSKAFKTKEEKYKSQFRGIITDTEKLKLLWENHSKSISNTAYVLGEFRRSLSDVHGESEVSVDPNYAQKALDCCVYIIKTFMSV